MFIKKWRFLSLLSGRKFLPVTKNTSIRYLSTQQEALTVHNIFIKSCGSIYQNWMKTKKFASVPDSDLIFRVKYFDTLRDRCQNIGNISTVVALHGAPGSCHDFSNLTNFLNGKGVRVVVPSFPDFSDYPPGIFRHSDEEKAQYVKDFLSALSISQVDLLICHSSAIYPGLLLCLDEKSMVKSLAMLNPATFTLSMPSMRFFEALKLTVKLSETPVLLKIMEVICPILMKMAKIPVRVERFLDPLLTATAMVNGKILKAKEKYKKLSDAGFPMFYAFSEDDKLIGGDNAYELAYLLGAENSDIELINKDGIIERGGLEKPNLKVMAFEKGSHYCFWKYADVINEEIYKFLTKATSDKSNTIQKPF